jgi:hypothetical protein
MTDGECYICGDSYTKRGMSRHLQACLPESDESTTTYHLRIVGAQRSDYWLHLLVEAETALSNLDSFLLARMQWPHKRLPDRKRPIREAVR